MPDHYIRMCVLNIPFQIPFYCYNNLHSSEKAFILNYGAWLWGFVHSAIRALLSSNIDVRRKDLGCRPLETWHTMCSWTSLCAHGHCNVGTGLSLLIPLKGNCNATAYKDIVYSCVMGKKVQAREARRNSKNMTSIYHHTKNWAPASSKLDSRLKDWKLSLNRLVQAALIATDYD